MALRPGFHLGMDAIKVDPKTKTTELLHHNVQGHPNTYNHYLIDQVQQLQNARRAKEFERFIASYWGELWHKETEFVFDKQRLLKSFESQQPEVDLETYSASQAIDFSEAYFKVSQGIYIQLMANETFIRTLRNVSSTTSRISQ